MHALFLDHIGPGDDLHHVAVQGVLRRLAGPLEHGGDDAEGLADVVGLEAHEGDRDHAADDDHQPLDAEESQQAVGAERDGAEQEQEAARQSEHRGADEGLKITSAKIQHEFPHLQHGATTRRRCPKAIGMP